MRRHGGGLAGAARGTDQRKRGAVPVSRRPRSTGRNGLGRSATPSRAATASATAVAWSIETPPCLTANAVASPAAYTLSALFDASVVVGRDEAFLGAGQAGEMRPAEPG